MKNLLFILVVAVIFSACGATRTNEMPTDAAGLKTVLKTKEGELTDLKVEIDSIKKQIERLDPEFNKKEIPVVDLLQLERKDFKHFVEVQGTVESGETRNVSSELPGKITSLKVKEGSRVSRGQHIASVDAESIRKGIEELNKSLELANDLFERQKRLWEKNIGSEIQFLQAKNNKERLEKSLASAESSLRKSHIYAPISGTVAMLMSKQGEVINPGMPILMLISTKEVKLIADVPEVYIQDVKRKDLVKVKIPVLDYENEVRVYRVGNVINNNNRTFDVEVKLNNPKNELKPNLLAMLMINDYSSEDAVAVPIELVQQDVSGNSFVFVAERQDSSYVVSKKMIETGVAFEGEIEVVEGLEGNELLVTTGSQYLAEGEEIKVNDALLSE